MTEKLPSLCKRMLAIMGDIDYIQKGEKTVNGQYRFVSHDQVTAALHPLFVKHQVVVLPSVVSSKQEGNRTEVVLKTSFVNADDIHDCIQIDMVGYGVDSGDKGPGKAISYAYKYALLKAFCLETGDDPDQQPNAVYEAVKCLEFDLLLPTELTKPELAKIQAFLTYSANCMKKSVEDVKREALNRMPEFLKACKNWDAKKV